MDHKRRSVVRALMKVVGPKSAENYEKAIYDMCSRVAEKDEVECDAVYASLSYEKVGQFVASRSREEREAVFADIRGDVCGWKSAIYKPQYENKMRLLKRSREKPKAVKGDRKCKAKGCDSDEFYVWSQQTRSGDEGMTHYFQCAKCGKRGREK